MQFKFVKRAKVLTRYKFKIRNELRGSKLRRCPQRTDMRSIMAALYRGRVDKMNIISILRYASKTWK